MGNCYWNSDFVPKTFKCLHCNEEVTTTIDFQRVQCECGKMHLLVSAVATREYNCKQGKDYEHIT